MDNFFLEIGLIIIVSTFLAFLARMLKQPLIPAYILTGLILGPGYNIIKNHDVIFMLSEIGIAFLLFVVGLEIDFKRLKDVGLISSLGGTLQVLVLFTIGYFIAIALSYTKVQAIYLGIVLAFSSTMVVVKLLSDRRELDTLHGRMILGILLMQDVLAIFALSALVTLQEYSSLIFFMSFIKGILLFAMAFFINHFLVSKLFKYAAKSTELLFLASISFCFMFSMLFAKFGFSIAIGAFVAGIVLGNLPYNFEIIGRVKSLRDFFATLFFVSLGMQIVIGSFRPLLIVLSIFILFVIFIKPLVTMVLVGFFGYKRSVSFMTSISLAQVSEFALIIVAQGMILGHITSEILSITILIAVVTISLTSYFIKFSNVIFNRISKYLGIFEKLSKAGDDLEYLPHQAKKDVVLCGYDRTGYSIFKKLVDLKKDFLVVDFNPEIIKRLIRQKTPCIYGDSGNEEILKLCNLKQVKLIISTIPDESTSMKIIKYTRGVSKDIVIFVTAYHVDDALHLYDAGADYVILPHFLGGDHVSLILEEVGGNVNRIVRKKISHIKELHHRKSLGHYHPRVQHISHSST